MSVDSIYNSLLFITELYFIYNRNYVFRMLNFVRRMALLFCLFGSDFHEGTVIYLSAVSFETRKFDTHPRPTFGYDATVSNCSPLNGCIA